MNYLVRALGFEPRIIVFETTALDQAMLYSRVSNHIAII